MAAHNASDEFLQDLLDESHDLVQSVAPDGRFLYVNRRWREVMGYEPESLDELSVFDVLHPDDREHCAALFGDLMQGGRIDGVEVRFLTAAGATLWVEGNVTCRLEDGRPVSTRGIFRDISDRKEITEALESSERRYRHLVDSSLGLICSHDFEGRILSANPAGAKALGFTPEELVGRNLREFIAPDVAGDTGRYLQDVRDRHEAVGLVRIRTRDGDERVWLYRNSVYEENDQPRYVLGHAHDVTELKLAEQELRRETLSDTLTGLRNRRGFHRLFESAFDNARREGAPLALLMINPDEFELVNERFGREKGDQALREIGRRLQSHDRWKDRVSRYGGAMFAEILPRTGPESELLRHADELRAYLSEKAYLGGELNLTHSVGLVRHDPRTAPQGVEGVTPFDLVRRTDSALEHARSLGGDVSVLWSPEVQEQAAGYRDHLAGIFTANIAKDYRNMRLLWTTVSAVSQHRDRDNLIEAVLQGLRASFKPQRVGLFELTGAEPKLIQGILRQAGSPNPWALLPEQRQLLQRACGEGKSASATIQVPDNGQVICFSVPLRSADQDMGCLYLDGPADYVELDESDHAILQAVADQLAAAFHRVETSRRETRRLDAERQRLQTELAEMREAVERSNLLYRSDVMVEVLEDARKVATTDATVLITGPSGTGKEVLARTLHELSPRRKKLPVVVDLAAISSSLIESELFGHEKGAFTGADQARAGRLVEADGGTVILDEIGELPLPVQSKLLRFVQEHELVSVGGHKVRHVDARVIAITNRDLETEVAAGRFREDLFYRLNVVTLRLPPLSERPDDVMLLAEHFLRIHGDARFRGAARFAPETRQVMMRYGWPGNVRELQNRVLRSVVLSEGPEILPADLDLPAPARGAAPSRGTAAARQPPPEPGDPWRDLAAALDHAVEVTLTEGRPRATPLGRWLDDELVLTAEEATQGSRRAAAQLLGLPATTLRRRLDRARGRRQEGGSPHLAAWATVRDAVHRVVALSRTENGDGNGESVPQRAHELLLQSIVRHDPDSLRAAAALAGVTEPTYRRRVEQLAETG